MNKEEECEHDWNHKRGNNYIKYFNCGYYPSIEKRSQCNVCFKEICYLCIKELYDIENNKEIQDIKTKENKNEKAEKLEKIEIYFHSRNY